MGHPHQSGGSLKKFYGVDCVTSAPPNIPLQPTDLFVTVLAQSGKNRADLGPLLARWSKVRGV